MEARALVPSVQELGDAQEASEKLPWEIHFLSHWAPWGAGLEFYSGISSALLVLQCTGKAPNLFLFWELPI